jgi:crotonobetainyl-CoA:carnitine CoA-transferase CaiB-like acyl-CoA transferase
MHAVVEPLLEHQLTGRDTERRHNRHRWMAPHAVYPCVGDDRWVAISVRDDREWQRLCLIMERPEWRCDPRFHDSLCRYEHQDELDELIANWTRERDAREIMERLQAAGIPAGVVSSPRDLLVDPQLRERGYYELVDHPGAPRVGRRRIQGTPFKMSATPPRIRKAAPLLGEDNARLLCGLLGYSEAELCALVEQGAVSSVPDPAALKGKPDILSLEDQKRLNLIRDFDPDYRQRIGLDPPAEATD